jgi:capsular polysaccharide biosynthesis protein
LLQNTSYLKNIGTESLDMLRFSFEDIIWMKADSFYKIKDLFFVSGLSPSGRMQAELIKELRCRFIGEGNPGKNRIYISRSNAAYRKVLNEDILFDVLKNYRFDMLHPEGLSLADQVKMFSMAGTLMSIHGAGLTNCIFMHPVSKVVELRRREGRGTNVGYWHLADSLNHQFYYYNGITDSDRPLVGKGCNLTVPPDDFEKKVLAII